MYDLKFFTMAGGDGSYSAMMEIEKGFGGKRVKAKGGLIEN